MSAKLSTGRVRQVYRFVEAHRRQFSVETMCKILEVAQSGLLRLAQTADFQAGSRGCSASAFDPGLVRRESRVAQTGLPILRGVSQLATAPMPR